jgi:hypothetical protein
VVARGFTVGGTGNTQKIMIEPHQRGAQISDTSAARFEAVVDINEAKLVTIEVHSPCGQRQAMTVNTQQVWLIPGRDITGDGIIVEVPGFAVDIMTPQAHEMLKLDGGQIFVPISANVVMMCGCPVSPRGLWDSQKYEIKASIKYNGQVLDTIPLAFAGKANTFSASYEASQEGVYEITVHALDPETGNAGVDKTTVIATK